MESMITIAQAEKECRELERFGKKMFPCSPPINVEFDLRVLKGNKNVEPKRPVWLL